MKGTGRAVAHGAVTILNAFANGKGGALGVDLWTRARVELRDGPGEFSVFNTLDPKESPALAVRTVERTLEHYGFTGLLSGEIMTESNIPIAVGLKSSSAAANAIALATVAALDKEPDDDTILEIVVEASIESGVSLTGAYDDAYACYHGGGVITDNTRRKVEKRFQPPAASRVLILVPDRRTYTGSLERSQFEPLRRILDVAYKEAIDSNPWAAMTINGLGYAALLGESQQPSMAALKAGALAAGLSGKGPAISAVVEGPKIDGVRRALSDFEGRLIEAAPNARKAGVEGDAENC